MTVLIHRDRGRRGFGVGALIVTSLALALAFAQDSSAACPPGRVFDSFTSYAMSPGPVEVVMEDFNEDGILDMLITNAPENPNVPGAGKITIRLGRGTAGVGDGTYGPPVSYPGGVRLRYIVAADFNEDGILDIAAPDILSNTVVVLKGLGAGGVGNGAFGPPTSFPVGSNPFGLALGDFNEDGILDLAVTNNGASSNLSVILGLGAGGVGNGFFGPPTNYTLGPNPAFVTSGDFNEDGITDLAAVVYGLNRVSVLLGNGAGGVGNGTFQAAVPYGTGGQPFDVVAEDFNEDGITDLATGNNAGGISVLLGNGAGGTGNGTFAPFITYPAGINCGNLCAADWNEDGITDLATVNAAVDSFTVILGQGAAGVGNGTFGSGSNYKVGDYPVDVLSRDVNEDGHQDLVVLSYGSGDARVFFGACVPQPVITFAPSLDAVRDVRADQGGKVFVVWQRSALDGDLGTTVNQYRVWRRIAPDALPAAGHWSGTEPADPGAAAWSASSPGDVRMRVDAGAITYWEAMVTLPAQRLPGYGYTAATTRDSLPGDNPYTAFFITALTADPNVFYDSNVDSGYSVDNLPPAPPSPFLGTWLPNGVALHWGASTAQDFANYEIYRGPDPSFVPSPANRIASPPDTGYVDTNGSTVDHYKLLVVDVHGNRSAAAVASPPQATPVELALYEASVDEGVARLSWFVDRGGVATMSLQRRQAESAWAAIAELTPDGTGFVRYADHSIPTGGRFAYRLSWTDSEGPAVSDEVWLDVPGFVLAFSSRMPNPSRGGKLRVELSLASDQPAQLEMFTATGRRVHSSSLEGAGVHHVDVGADARLAPGVYWLRLAQDGRTVRAKVALLP